jgi:hypothetical protein
MLAAASPRCAASRASKAGTMECELSRARSRSEPSQRSCRRPTANRDLSAVEQG